MTHPIPREFVTSVTVPKAVKGVEYEFVVQFTVFGEVLSVNNLFAQLPKEAQRLMLGRDYAEVRRELAYFTRKMRFVLPLVVLRIWEEETWEPILTEVEALEKVKGFKQLSHRRHIRDEWVRRVWRYRSESRRLQLQTVKRMLVGKDWIRQLQHLRKHFGELYNPVLFMLAEETPHTRMEKIIYQKLGQFGRRKTRQRLSRQLANPDLVRRHEFILEGLSYFKHPDLKRQLIDYYWAYPEMNERVKFILLKTLSRYRDPGVESIFKQEYTGSCIAARNLIFETLVRQGVSQSEMAGLLHRAFSNWPFLSTEELMAVLRNYQDITDDDLLPSGEELLELWDWGERRWEGKLLVNEIQPLLQRSRPKEEIVNDLTKRLEGNDQREQIRILERLTYIGDHRQVEAILSCVQPTDFHALVNQAAFQAVKKILLRDPGLPALDSLLALLEHGHETWKRHIIWAMMPLLDRRTFPMVFQPLKQQLANDDPEIRIEAIRALGQFRQRKAKLLIRQMLKDPDIRVNRMAGRVLGGLESRLDKPKTGSGRLVAFGFFVLLIVFILIFTA